MDKLKIAHIGTGRRGSGTYLPLIAKLTDALELIAVCDAREESVTEQGAKYNVPAYTDTEQMLDEMKPGYLCHRNYTEQQPRSGAPLLRTWSELLHGNPD